MKKLVLSAMALTLSAGLVGTAVPANAEVIPAPAGADPAPVTGGAAYLAAQPGADNLIKTYYVFPADTPAQSYTDYGLTIDAGYALDAVGGQTAKLTAMTDALVASIGSYAFGGGSQAKLSSFLLSQGRTGAAIDELVTNLETHIATTTPIEGRLVDADPNDYNTPLTQAYAASALNNAGSDLANSARSFLLDQQCTAGFFRDSFAAKDATDQTCNGASPAATGSVDTTGLALLMLQDQKSKPVVKAAINAGLDWLATAQAANGSFNGGNANSTGLAAWALGLYGRTADATEAASWVRGHQLANAGACTPFAAADQGAIALDDLGYANAQAGPFDLVDNSVATRATTQALPALLWADGGANAGAFTLTGPSGFVPAGSTQQFGLKGAPGDTVCVGTTKVVLGATGAGTATVNVPATTGALTVSAVDAGGETHTAKLTGLAKTKLGVKLAKSTVAKGQKVVVTVSGLEAGETVRVTLGGKKVTAKAKPNGKVKVKIAATKIGKTKVKVVGQYKNRQGKASLTVTK